MRLMTGAVAVLVVLGACGGGDPATDTAATIPSTAATAAPTSSPTIPSTTTSAVTTTGEVAATSTTITSEPSQLSLGYEELDIRVPFPIFMTPLPGTDLAVIAVKNGSLWLYDGVDVLEDPFLDIRDLVRNDGEQGLLGVAFSPTYTDDSRLFLHYTDNDGDTVLSEFRADELAVDPATEIVLFRVGQPARNHNGGMLEFGPNGLLYLGLGDGGGSNDRFGHGQNEDSALGALLRFDVSTVGVAEPAGQSFAAEAVWSIGLRNPWRFAIDPPSGLILIADVGQNGYEEVSAVPLDTPGVNYGWPVTEGLHCFSPRSDCDIDGLTLPVVEVAHGDAGTCSITGGFVYRGSAIPELDGHFFFSDFCGGYLRSFSIDASTPEVVDWTEEAGRVRNVASFGRDAAGELYVLSSDGRIFKIVPIRA